MDPVAKYGKLQIIRYAKRENGRDYWLCKCDCGNESIVKQCLLVSGNTKSCGCGKAHGTGGTQPKTIEELKIYFKLFKKEQSNCWIFDGYKIKGGYGSITWNKKPWIAHRLSWYVFNGDIPKGQFICHKCDTPACVNPDHLFLGDYQVNSDDKVNKKRHRIGSKQPNAKLTEELVVELRKNESEYNIAELARQTNISEGALRHMFKRRTWKHI